MYFYKCIKSITQLENHVKKKNAVQAREHLNGVSLNIRGLFKDIKRLDALKDKSHLEDTTEKKACQQEKRMRKTFLSLDK